MAKIKNTTAYPTVTPQVDDLLIGTDVNDNNKTVTFTVGSLTGGAPTNQDLNSVLGVGNISLLNIELNGTGSALGSSITAIDIFPTTISAGGLGAHGTVNQVLTSTGAGAITWADAPGTSQSWNDTLAISPVATANPTLNGVFTINDQGGLSILGTSYLTVEGDTTFKGIATFDDGVDLDFSSTSKIIINSLEGAAGQFLQNTATGMAWSSDSTLTTPTLQQVVTAGNTILDSSINLTGNGGISLDAGNAIISSGTNSYSGTNSFTASGLLSTDSGIALTGSLFDGTGTGSAGQVLSATLDATGLIAGVSWIDNAAAQDLQSVLDAGNSATQTINLTGAVKLLGATGELSVGANAFISLLGNRGVANQVLTSGGPSASPVWNNAGTGTLTSFAVVDTTFINSTLDILSNPAIPSLKTELITSGLISTGSGGVIAGSYDTVTGGTGYSVGTNLSTTAVTGTGAGIVVNIITTSSGAVTASDITIVSGGAGYADLDRFKVNQTGSNGDFQLEVDGIATNTYYGVNSQFTEPAGKDWDLAVTSSGSVLTVTNSDGTRSSDFTLQGTGGAVFSNTGNNISLGFSGSGTGTVQSITLTDSAAAISTAITGSGSFTFSEQAVSATYLRTTSAVAGFGITLSTEIPTIQVVATKGGTLLNTALTIQNGNGTTNNSFVLGTTAAPSVANAGEVLAYNSTSGGYMEWVAQSGGGGMTSWTLSDNAGTPNTSAVSNGETATIAGGTGITSVLNSGTRVLTLTNTGVTELKSGMASPGNTVFKDAVTITPSGDIAFGDAAVATINNTPVAVGGDYLSSRVYKTSVNSGAGKGASIKVLTVTAGGITTYELYSTGAGYAASDVLSLIGGGSNAANKAQVEILTVVNGLSISTTSIPNKYDLSATADPISGNTDPNITLTGSNSVVDNLRIKGTGGTTVTKNSPNQITIDSAAASGLTSFSIITSPVSTTGTVNTTNSTITFTEQVNTINAVAYNYIGLDISATNILTVGLTAPTGGLDGSTVITSYLRADNTWAVPPDTTYNVFTGATNAPADGTSGLVPQPLASTLDYNKFLKGDGTWATPAGAGTLTGITAALPITVDLSTDPAVPALDINTFAAAASGSVAGLKGIVPAPQIGDYQTGKFLKVDTTWAIPDTYIGAVQNTSVGIPGYVPSASVIQNDHFLRGDSTWVIPTDTNTLYTADSTTLTLNTTQFSITTGSSSDLTLGVTPTQLAGAPGTGSLNQVLKSDGSGGFAWGNSGSGVTSINGTTGVIVLKGKANSSIGQSAALSVTITSGGSGYSVDFYPTTFTSSATGLAEGLVMEVLSVNVGGGVLTASVYGGGTEWAVGDTFKIKYGITDCVCAVATISPVGTINNTTWRGLSGTASDQSAADYDKNTISRFEAKEDVYSSGIIEYVGIGGVGGFNEYFIQLGETAAFTPSNGINLLVGKDIGIITTLDNPNITIGKYGAFDYSNVLCVNNISIGRIAGTQLTTGFDNVFMGNSAGFSSTSADSNIGIGNDALLSLVGTKGNVAIGYQADRFLQSGEKNVTIGYQAKGSGAVTNSSFGVTIGAQAQDQGFGFFDICIGNFAGSGAINNSNNPESTLNTDHMKRVYIGFLAGAGNSGGLAFKKRYNVGEIAIGANAAHQQSTTNTASLGGGVYIGFSAGAGSVAQSEQSSALTQYHVAIGARAMTHSNGGRLGQIAIGFEASVGAIGVNIDTYNTSTQGIAIGYQAEGLEQNYDNITRTGEGNIAIGYLAAGTAGGVIQGNTIALGTSAMAEGAETIAVGRLAKAGGAAQAGSIAIGFQAEAQFNNSVAIGRSATSTDANQFVVGSSTYPVGTVIVAPPATTTTTWTVKINGTDYKIPMYAA